MKTGTDYRNVRRAEIVTSSSDGVALDRTKPVHFIKTDGGQDLNYVTLADGTVNGERHKIAVVVLGHAEDTFRIVPAKRRSGDFLAFGTLAVGSAVELIWNSADDCWDIFAGNQTPAWGAIE